MFQTMLCGSKQSARNNRGQTKNTARSGSGLPGTFWLGTAASWHSCFKTPRRVRTAGRSCSTALCIKKVKKKRRHLLGITPPVYRMSARPMTDCCGLEFHWEAAEIQDCGGAEEASDTRYVLVSSFLTRRSQLSIEHSFYRRRHPWLLPDCPLADVRTGGGFPM